MLAYDAKSRGTCAVLKRQAASSDIREREWHRDEAVRQIGRQSQRICKIQSHQSGTPRSASVTQSPHDKRHVYGRFQLVKLGVQLRHVELQYNLVLFKAQRQALIQRLPAHLSFCKGSL